jgi:hypothetical protein
MDLEKLFQATAKFAIANQEHHIIGCKIGRDHGFVGGGPRSCIPLILKSQLI